MPLLFQNSVDTASKGDLMCAYSSLKGPRLPHYAATKGLMIGYLINPVASSTLMNFHEFKTNPNHTLTPS